ncbi:hypothetical protein BGZ79_010935 [Entomortierella chlamydospora]|nr:hypothetical protein BGZ79_010935 [Entomortierella chlamydospora]
MDELHKRRPPNTSFKQQRLKAWQPIMTAKAVLPTFFIVGVLFAPLGGLYIWRNNQVTEMSFDYTACSNYLQPVPVPESSFKHSSSVAEFDRPTYMVTPNVTRTITSAIEGSTVAPVTYTVQQCTITLTIPVDLKPPVMMYYKLTNFYQNHRRYAKSLDYKQLQGNPSSLADLKTRGGCSNLDTELIYPCGLIANSLFNDTISNLVAVGGGAVNFDFQSTGIASAADHGKYTKYGYTDLSQILPPANWRLRYPNGMYTADFPPPDISQDEHFQVWMRTAGWPTFLKTYGRNNVDTLKAGNYTMTIDMNFPIHTYGGKKYIVFSTISGLGGRNSFLGIGYIVVAVLCAGLGVIFTALHIVRPRIIGDHSKISFGGEATSHTRSSIRADDIGGNRIRSRYEDN